jgi:hypothetical protein
MLATKTTPKQAQPQLMKTGEFTIRNANEIWFTSRAGELLVAIAFTEGEAKITLSQLSRGFGETSWIRE